MAWEDSSFLFLSLLRAKAGPSKSVFEKDWAKREEEVRLFFSR